MPTAKKIIVGLGNPGREYGNTYHNVGAVALREIGAALAAGGAELDWKTHRGLFEYAAADGTVLVRPLTFMNESGAAVREALKKWNGSPRNLIVIHDESDLTIGTYKLSSGRSAAGHKGIQSIMDALGSKEFLRVRIGIRPAQESARRKAGEFVLTTISKKDRAALAPVFEKITRNLRETRGEPA